MELNTIQNKSNWGKATESINTNFAHVGSEIDKLKYAAYNSKLYPSLEVLQQEKPNPSVGDWAIVGDTIPGAIYRCSTEGVWSATGETGGGYGMNVTETNVTENNHYGDIINNPDDEDLTEETNENEEKVIKLADKEYNAAGFSGLGRVYLRKNVSAAKNVLTQDMMSKANTRYIIQYDYDLNGATINIPEGCILDFQGGSISNGTFTGETTEILWNSNRYIFDNINIAGTWRVRKISTLMFKDLSGVNALKNVFNLTHAKYINDVQIEKNDYDYVFENTENEKHCIDIKSNTNVSVLGTIRLKENNFTHYQILSITDAENVSISGNGYIYGDKPNHTGTTGEWGHCIAVYNSINIRINGVNIHDAWGDCIVVSSISGQRESNNVRIDGCIINNGRRQGISIVRSNNVHVNNCVITNINGTDPQSAIDYEPNPSQKQYNCIVENCIIDNCTEGIIGYAPETTEAANYIIRNCKLSNITYNAIGCNGIKNVDISNCQIDISDSGNSNATTLSAGYISMRNTTINAKNSTVGIFQMNNEKLIVEGCTITCSNYAIRSAKNMYLDKNTFTCKEFAYINGAIIDNSIICNNIINGNVYVIGSQYKFYNNIVTVEEGSSYNKFNTSSEHKDSRIYNNVFKYTGTTVIDSVVSFYGKNNIIENNIVYTNDATKYGIMSQGTYNVLINNIVDGAFVGGRKIGPRTEGTFMTTNNASNAGSITGLPAFPAELNDSVTGFRYYCTSNNAPVYHFRNSEYYNSVGKFLQNTIKEVSIGINPNKACKITFPMFTGFVKIKIGSHYNTISNEYYAIYTYAFRKFTDAKRAVKSHVEIVNPLSDNESINLANYKTRAAYFSFPIISEDGENVNIYIKGYNGYNLTSTLTFEFDGILNTQKIYPSCNITTEYVDITAIPSEAEFRDVFICPVHGTTSDIDELLLPYKGCMAYNDTANKIVFGDGTKWVDSTGMEV